MRLSQGTDGRQEIGDVGPERFVLATDDGMRVRPVAIEEVQRMTATNETRRIELGE